MHLSQQMIIEAAATLRTKANRFERQITELRLETNRAETVANILELISLPCIHPPGVRTPGTCADVYFVRSMVTNGRNADGSLQLRRCQGFRDPTLTDDPNLVRSKLPTVSIGSAESAIAMPCNSCARSYMYQIAYREDLSDEYGVNVTTRIYDVCFECSHYAFVAEGHERTPAPT